MKRLPFLLNDYGMLLVLLLLCAVFSLLTLERQKATGAEGAAGLSSRIQSEFDTGEFVFIAAGTKPEDAEFSAVLEERLESAGFRVRTARGAPSVTKSALAGLVESSDLPALIAASPSTAGWNVFTGVAEVPVLYPRERTWPTFLNRGNLLSVASQISKIAIIAIGMTMVIITAGIDLSVGSLLALTAVATAWAIEKCGAESAPVVAMLGASFGGILVGALVGLFSGGMITLFRMPPFIVTLAVMFIASGLAFEWSDGNSIHDLPPGYKWLGRGFTLGIPNSVLLMAALYIAAHFVMTRTALGRYIYAVGGNAEAARLAGVPVWLVLLFVYTICGLLAGVAGVITTSELEAGSPTFGDQVELMVIASVVVGGTSIMGGEGRIFGTLIGALIISVISNGMNLNGITEYWQKVILGAVILVAVLIDQLKHRFLGPAET